MSGVHRSVAALPGGRLVVALLMACLWCPAEAKADLKPGTAEAFDRYVRLTEARMRGEEAGDPGFLYIERLPAAGRQALEGRARRGELLIERLQTREGGKRVEAPDVLIHHWVGLVFVPGASAADAVALLQDYDRHDRIYAPAVARSRVLGRDGDRFRVFLRFYMKKVIAVTLDTEHEAHFTRLAPGRAFSRIRSTRVQEVEHAGTPDERLKAPGEGRGFTWRLNTYWRFLESEDGTWVQCESLTLSRDIPFGLGWIIGPFVTDVPKESLTFTLETTRRALTTQKKRQLPTSNSQIPTPKNGASRLKVPFGVRGWWLGVDAESPIVNRQSSMRIASPSPIRALSRSMRCSRPSSVSLAECRLSRSARTKRL